MVKYGILGVLTAYFTHPRQGLLIKCPRYKGNCGLTKPAEMVFLRLMKRGNHVSKAMTARKWGFHKPADCNLSYQLYDDSGSRTPF